MSPTGDGNDSVKRSNARQRQASDPSRSSWVSAHAGSGKTTVLAQRVIRLLTRGVPPTRILCLTFTRAAAAEMAQRVFRILAEWTGLDDDELTARLEAIGEAAGDGPDEAQLRAARRLFAAAIDTPGGLKIQTLHAFCERLLHAFPFEADVAANFRVLEDFDSARLLQAAMERTLGAARADAGLGAAFAEVAESLSGERLQSAVKAIIGQRHALAAFDARDDFLRRAAPGAWAAPGRNRSHPSKRKSLAATTGAKARRRWIEALRGGQQDGSSPWRRASPRSTPKAPMRRARAQPTSPSSSRTTANRANARRHKRRAGGDARGIGRGAGSRHGACAAF